MDVIDQMQQKPFFLVEWPPELENTKEIYFRGLSTEAAILCSEKYSYQLKRVETSNSFLLLKNVPLVPEDPLSPSVYEWQRTSNSYIECKLNEPDLSRIHKVLTLKNRLKRMDIDDDNRDIDTSFNSLLDIVPMSVEQMQLSLTEIKAIEWKGQWRLVDAELINQCWSFLQVIISLFEQEHEKEPTVDEIIDSMLQQDNVMQEAFPTEIVSHVLSLLGISGAATFKLDLPQLGLLKAKLVMKQKIMPIDTFLHEWVKELEDVNPDLSWLQGWLVQDPLAHPPSVFVLEEIALPIDIQKRLQMMFSIKGEWSFEELWPYLVRLYPAEKMAKEVLLKYGNHVNKGDSVVYTMKHSMR